ncbi:uncharacterized protein [Blastocystis hominis]|uniref:Trafficking protein particle complex subunit n=1 Tax=Blastocystis hominis TaxID=12968 RepID=D8M9P5_BLAHO|nr:uncharacterized protein [Blastocystis hominis]CBK24784.2 unnamed protein product [Blastocystis hominis]|eukprot:XP_012898832.1 uncharacterized protein [Blastocystis hominis]
MSVYSLYIINKSGGLIFSKDFNAKNPLSSNDRMRLASTFHSLTAISTQFAPAKNSRGINYVLAETVSIHSYRINFLVISNPTVPYLEGLLDEIYVLFADYVMKNPFYELEMPIRCSLFEEKLDTLIASHYPF